jgi:hypothetical protein
MAAIAEKCRGLEEAAKVNPKPETLNPKPRSAEGSKRLPG